MEHNRIIILEDEWFVAQELATICTNAGFVVCAVLSGTENVIQEINNFKPDMLLCDIKLKSNKNGLKLVKKSQKTAYIPVVFITVCCSQMIIESLSEIKHEAYITKPFTEKQVLATLNLVWKKNYDIQDVSSLTAREFQIAQLIIKGIESKYIAKKLNISEHTFWTHRKNIYRKLEVGKVSQLIDKLSDAHLN